MSQTQGSQVVRNDEGRHEYVMSVGGEEATTAYEVEGDIVTFTHTYVPESARGQGAASRLIGGALADVRRRGLRVVPLCEAVVAYMRRHADSQDLLAPEGRQAMTG